MSAAGISPKVAANGLPRWRRCLQSNQLTFTGSEIGRKAPRFNPQAQLNAQQWIADGLPLASRYDLSGSSDLVRKQLQSTRYAIL